MSLISCSGLADPEPPFPTVTPLLYTACIYVFHACSPDDVHACVHVCNDSVNSDSAYPSATASPRQERACHSSAAPMLSRRKRMAGKEMIRGRREKEE